MHRVEEDRDLAVHMTESIIALYPGCPPAEARAIALHTSRRGSGRVGRTAAGGAFEPEALNAGYSGNSSPTYAIRQAPDAWVQPQRRSGRRL